jgi:hypothetical protein
LVATKKYVITFFIAAKIQPKISRKQPKAAKSSQKQPKAAKSSQKQPKSAESIQNQPKSAKNSHKQLIGAVFDCFPI